HHLESVKVDASHNIVDFRLPIQYVIRPNQKFRGFSGRIASGRIRPGEEIMVLPSRLTSRVKEIVTHDENLDVAFPGDSVTLTIEDDIDISRGDMIVRKNNIPNVSSDFEAYLCWMSQDELELNKPYVIKHTTHTAQVYVEKLVYRMNVDHISREQADTLKLNEIGRVKLKTSRPLFYDPYQINQQTGSFIIIDPDTNATIGAGLIRAGSTESELDQPLLEEDKPLKEDVVKPDTDIDSQAQVSPNVHWEPWNISREEREKRNGHKAVIFWLTGISGAGKSTIAKELEKRLWDDGKQTILLDGDQIRHGLCGDLGFRPADRTENIRRVGEVARLFFEHGNIVICTFVSPYKKDRDRVRSLFPDGSFFEVHVSCEPETAQSRDPKGLYEKAKSGEIEGLTGYDADYEPSEKAEILIDTDEQDVQEAVEIIIGTLK
ncbi:MAG: adenylyl-sulfate kinase, partial [Balneolaceae bacterium]